MKRIALTVAVCAVLGVMTTVAVAWGIAVAGEWVPLPNRAVNVSDGRGSQNMRSGLQVLEGVSGHIVSRSGRAMGQLTDWSGRVINGNVGRMSQATDRPALPPVPPWVDAVVIRPGGTNQTDAYGWPWLAMVQNNWIDFRPPGQPPQLLRSNQLSMMVRGRMYTVPLAVWWPGFAANIAVYWAAWLALGLSLRQVKRYRRKASGRCLECGYNRTGGASAICPECGAGSAAI